MDLRSMKKVQNWSGVKSEPLWRKPEERSTENACKKTVCLYNRLHANVSCTPYART